MARCELGDREQHRRSVRERILTDVWWSVPAAWTLTFLWYRMIEWLRENRVSFGFFVSWPEDEGSDQVGRSVAVLSVDSPSRLVVVGWSRLDGRDVRRLADHGRRIRIRVLGWLRITADVDASLATAVLESVKVIGVSRVPRSIQLAGR